MSPTTPPKPPRVNVGALARWSLRQSLGTDKGNQVIALIEDGVPAAWAALKRGDFGPLLAIIPAEHLPGLLKALISIGAGKP